MTAKPAAPSSLHLVPPELRPALDGFPGVDFSNGPQAYRGDFIGREMPPLPPELDAVTCEQRFVPGPAGAGDVRVLIYTPPGDADEPRPALFDIHGGGFVIGAPEQDDRANREVAAALGAVVVATSYRLAPETPWPGARDDCYAALCWMQANAEELGIDPARIALTGQSAGGGHAAAVAIHARDRARAGEDAPRLCLQLLDVPMLDDRTCTLADPHPYTGEFLWRHDLNRYGWQALLGRAPGGPDVPEAAVPARTADLTDLPPTYIMIGALDLFLEESLEYARRLTRAGVPVELHLVPGGFHGFTLAKGTPLVNMVDRLKIEALARAFGIAPPA